MGLFEYLNNLKKIKKYCKENNIQISSFFCTSNFASYYHSLIGVSFFQSFDNQIATYLHEIGHIIHWKNLSPELRQHVLNVRKNFNNLSHNQRYVDFSKDDIKTLLSEENLAWSLGLSLGKELKVKIPKNYYSIWKDSVKSYEGSFKIHQAVGL